MPTAPRAEIQTDFRVLMRAEGIPVRSRKKKYRRQGRCQKCGITHKVADMTIDHIVPQCRLKDHPRIKNHPANKQTLCSTCNNIKSDGAAIDYRGDPHLHELLNRMLAQAGLSIKVFRAIPAD
jgi:NMD protein affecting ribosome stability and mRNA decay